MGRCIDADNSSPCDEAPHSKRASRISLPDFRLAPPRMITPKQLVFRLVLFSAHDLNRRRGESTTYYAVVLVGRCERRTISKTGYPDPAWNYEFLIPICNYRSDGDDDDLRQLLGNLALTLEVIRVDAWQDPGTSNGELVVGRAQAPLWAIPVEKKHVRTISQRINLHRPSGIEEGFITATMYLMTI